MIPITFPPQAGPRPLLPTPPALPPGGALASGQTQPHAPALTLPTLSEAFSAHPLDAGAIGFALAALPPGLVLWAQDRMARREHGVPCLAGMGRRLLRLDLSRPVDVLAAMEDGLSAPLAAVVGEIHGDPPALSFTATRRLALRAERAGRVCWLIRHRAAAQPSAARQRWRITSLPSAPDPDDPFAPGDPRWRAELFRCRDGQPGTWVVRHDRAADRLDFSALAGDGALAAGPSRLAR